MALIKKFKDDVRGLNTEYHMISKLSIDNKSKEISITVDSYTNESFRDLEKEDKKKLNLMSELQDRVVSKLESDGENYMSTDEFKDLDNQIKNISKSLLGESTYVKSRSYILPKDLFKGDFTFEDGYNYLKGLEDFNKSKDA